MKIRWLTSDFTVAEVTRGLWSWRESALVEQVKPDSWQYAITCDAVESDLVSWLNRKQAVAIVTDHERRNWTRGELPRAKVVKP